MQITNGRQSQRKVPDIGDLDEVAVIELLVKVGDTIKPEQSLITVESDKASMEIPASDSGVVKQGTVVVLLEAADRVLVNSAVQAVDSAGVAHVFIATLP